MPQQKKTISRRFFLRTAGAVTLTGFAGRTFAYGQADGAESKNKTEGEARILDRDEALELLNAPEALFRPTTSGCTVHWLPKENVAARILSGSRPDELAVIKELDSGETPQVYVQGFQSDSDFYLQCQFRKDGGEKWLAQPVRRLKTLSGPGKEFQVCLLADSHIYSSIDRPQAMINLEKAISMVTADRPDFAVFLGDEAGVYYGQDPANYMSQQNAHERWIQWRNIYAPLVAAVPSFLCIGNHEGEAGYYQTHLRKGTTFHYQRWGTIARKHCFLNPLPDTYPEGGEDEGWIGDQQSAATGGASKGNRSPLQNYFAWTCGDALFVVLDVHRYTNVGGKTPVSVDQWTLGAAQLNWFEEVLKKSRAKWKVVFAHHLVGGYAWDLPGRTRETDYVYGRGGARYAKVGEQNLITEIMNRYGARFLFYGHDHIFAHQQAEDIHFVCCGRPTFIRSNWWNSPGWREAYGLAASQNPHNFYAANGYVRLTISPKKLTFEYIRSGSSKNQIENVAQKEGEVVYAYSIDA